MSETFFDRAMNTVEAGKRLGNLHSRDVCLLIKKGLLRAKKQIVRGTGSRPRYLVLESAISEYLESLENAQPTNAPSSRKIRRGNLSGVIEFV